MQNSCGRVQCKDAAALAPNSSSGETDVLSKRLYAAAGLPGIYVSWALYSWFIFTYGASNMLHSLGLLVCW